MRPGHFLFDTALGVFGLAWNERGLTRLQLPGRDPADSERRLTTLKNGFQRPECVRDARVALDALLPEPISALVVDIGRYANGETVQFREVRVELPGVDGFRREIYREARRLAFGEVTTYGELAARAGFEGQAQRTGQAMGANPLPLVIPCHRVLAAGRKIGGFSAPGGTDTKLRMLALEGVDLSPPAPAQASFAF